MTVEDPFMVEVGEVQIGQRQPDHLIGRVGFMELLDEADCLLEPPSLLVQLCQHEGGAPIESNGAWPEMASVMFTARWSPTKPGGSYWEAVVSSGDAIPPGVSDTAHANRRRAAVFAAIVLGVVALLIATSPGPTYILESRSGGPPAGTPAPTAPHTRPPPAYQP